MFFRKKGDFKLSLTPNSLKYFSQIDIMLQALSFSDGYFDGVFIYFRNFYFSIIDTEINKLPKQEKFEFLNLSKTVQNEMLAGLSKVLKEEVFDKYLNTMYSVEEQIKIRQEIKQLPK